MDLISREKAIRVTIGMTSETGIDEAPLEYAESNLKKLPSAFEGMKCGEIIEALFPISGIWKDVDFVEVVFEGETHTTYFSRDFWDSPYKGVNE